VIDRSRRIPSRIFCRKLCNSCTPDKKEKEGKNILLTPALLRLSCVSLSQPRATLISGSVYFSSSSFFFFFLPFFARDATHRVEETG